MSREQFQRLGQYREIYQRLGAEDALGIVALVEPDVAVGVTLLRASWGFTEREVALIDAATPHILRAQASAMTMTRLRESLARGEAQAVPRSETVVLSPEGRIVSATTRARALLSSYVGSSPAPTACPTSSSAGCARSRQRPRRH